MVWTFDKLFLVPECWQQRQLLPASLDLLFAHFSTIFSTKVELLHPHNCVPLTTVCIPLCISSDEVII